MEVGLPRLVKASLEAKRVAKPIRVQHESRIEFERPAQGDLRLAQVVLAKVGSSKLAVGAGAAIVARELALRGRDCSVEIADLVEVDRVQAEVGEKQIGIENKTARRRLVGICEVIIRSH